MTAHCAQCQSVELGCTETCTVPVYSTIFIALRICLEHVYRLSVRLMPLYIPYNCTVVFLFKRCCIIHAVGVLPTSHLHVDTTVVNGWNFLRITYMFELRLIFQAIQRVGIGDSVRFAINRARGLYTVILSYTLYDNLLTVYTRYVPIFRFICIITYSVKLP